MIASRTILTQRSGEDLLTRNQFSPLPFSNYPIKSLGELGSLSDRHIPAKRMNVGHKSDGRLRPTGARSEAELPERAALLTSNGPITHRRMNRWLAPHQTFLRSVYIHEQAILDDLNDDPSQERESQRIPVPGKSELRRYNGNLRVLSPALNGSYAIALKGIV